MIRCFYHKAETVIFFFFFFFLILLRIRNVSDKRCRENQNTHFVFSYIFSIYCAVYEIMWENIVERGRQQMAIWCMRVACWIPDATNTHSQYVILIAFPPQKLLHKRLSIFRYTYTDSFHCTVARY
jgi:hypothetical protein